MLFFDISDTSIEAIRLSKSFLTGEAVTAFNRSEFKNGPIEEGEIKDKNALKKIIVDLLKNAKPKPMKDRECAFTLPDKRVYTHRFALSQKHDSQTVFSLIKSQAEKLIPQPIEELTYNYLILGQKKEGKEEGEILLAAVPTVIINGYIELFNDLGLEPKLAVPESVAAYSFLSPLIKAGGAVLYLDVGEKITTATLMDQQGVVETFSEPVQTDKLFAQIENLFAFACTQIGGCIKQVILGGGGSLTAKPAEFESKLKVSVISAEEVFKTFKLPIKVNFGDLSKVTFVNVLGLALLSGQEQPLNLIKT